MTVRTKLLLSAIFIPGFVLVIYGAWGPGQGSGTPSGDLLNKIGFAVMFIALAITLVVRLLGRRKVS